MTRLLRNAAWALFLVSGLWLLLRGGPETPAAPETRTTSDDQAARATLHVREIEPDEDPTAESETVSTPAAEGEQVHAPEPPRLVWDIELDVVEEARAVTFDPPARVTIRHHQERFSSQRTGPPVVVKAHKSGTLSVDMTWALRAFGSMYGRRVLQLTFEHPAYDAPRLHVDLNVPTSYTEEGRALPPVVFRIRPISVIAGRVRVPGENKVRALVGLFARSAAGLDPTPLHVVRARRSGTFQIKHCYAGEALLIAADPERWREGGGARPASQVLHLESEGQRLRADLVLEPGHALTGTVVKGNQPLSGWIACDWAGAEQSFWLSYEDWYEVELVDVDGVIHTTGQPAQLEDGEFSISGLSEGPYDLVLLSVDGITNHPTTEVVLRRGVSSGEHIELDLESSAVATLSVTVNGLTEAMLPARIALAPAGAAGRSASDGVRRLSVDKAAATFLVAPGSAWDLGLVCQGELVARRTIAAPAAGESQDIQLRAREAAPPGHVRVIPELAADRPERFAFQLASRGDLERVLHVDATISAEEGTYDLRCPPGEYVLSVQPGGGSPFGPPWMATVQAINVAQEDTVELRVPLRQGAWLTVYATDEHRRHVPAVCDLEADNGSRVHGAWHARVTGFTPEKSATGELPGGAPALFQPPIEPGGYTLRLSAPGHRSVTRSFRARAGDRVNIYADMPTTR